MESMSLKPHKKIQIQADVQQLPFSLIESEILTKLPAKSDIGRCMCVCKQWKSFVSTHAFARMHLRRHGTINDYKLVVFDDQLFTIPLNNYVPDPKPTRNSIFILATLHGLVCLCSKESNQLVFWNPLTRAYKKLSPGPTLYFSKNFSLNAVGFYMDSSNDYKLVCVIAASIFGAYIYSHRLDSWRPIGFLFARLEPCVWSSATLCGHCLYFTVRAYTLDAKGEWWIMCFDVKTETFKRIEYPLVPYGVIDRDGSLVVLNGCIHLCVSYKVTTYYKQGDLWRLDAGDDGWVKVAAFSDPWDKGLSVTRGHICTEASAEGDWLVVLDEENNSFRKVDVEDFTTHYQYFCSPSWEYRSSRMIYVETLVSPNP